MRDLRTFLYIQKLDHIAETRKVGYKMKNVHTILMLTVVVLQANIGLAQKTTSVTEALQTIMRQARNNEPISGVSDAQLKVADPQQVLSLLAPYEKDPAWTVRRMAHLYEVRLARLQPTPEVRQEVTKRLVEASIAFSVHPQANFWLLSFTKKDFNDESKALIGQALAKEDPYFHHILICGVANMTEQLPRLKQLLIDEVAYRNDPNNRYSTKWYYTLGWRARLAKARMGIEEDIKKCIELAEAEQDSTERVLRILPQIGYIRQPEAIKYLQRYLESNKRLPRVKPTAPGMSYSNYVMSILAESLSNYPVKKSESRSYSEEEIDLCRKWMAKQTKWEIIR